MQDEQEFMSSLNDDEETKLSLQLQQQVEELGIWHSITQLARRHHQRVEDEEEETNNDSTIIDTMEELERILTTATTTKVTLAFVQRLADQEYFSWHAYYQSLFIKRLKTLLQQSGYPNIHNPFEDTFILHRLEDSSQRLSRHLNTTTNTSTTTDIVTREFLRPFVQRIVFHFVTHDTERPTTYRTERLPEWLFQYVQKHVFDAGVLEFVQTVDDPGMAFLQELIQLLQYVLAERNVFREENSPPAVLMKHIEQLLLFDWNMQQLLAELSSISNSITPVRIRRLVDVFVVGDEELWDWWLQNEQVIALKTYDTEDDDTNSMTSIAELICARFRSMQRKASLLSLRCVYVSTVLAPFCTRLLDVWREQADAIQETDYRSWSEWIQATHLVIDFLQQQQEESTTIIHGEEDETNDVLRFAASLQALEDAVVDDFAKTLVERVLMMDAKLAAYLMRCSFQVASNKKSLDQEDDAVELTEVRHVLMKFHQETVGENDNPLQEYSLQRMRESVLSLLAEQFLNAALNTDGMTTELAEQGSTVFAYHVQSVLDIFAPTATAELFPFEARRLLDVTRLMSMECTELSGIGNALCGLAGLPAPLTMEPFVEDDRLAEEAMAMIQAKGLLWMDLEDVISILNRRIDLLGG